MLQFFRNCASRAASATLLFFRGQPSRHLDLEPLEPRALLAGHSTFAIIGDYGVDNSAERAVARLIRSWKPQLILTVGDNNYRDGSASTIDRNIGKYFQKYIHPYTGDYGKGSPDGVNRFFPALGNHDLISRKGAPFFDYFTLPGNERYYRVRHGTVEFFAINSNPSEPHLGYKNERTSTSQSKQAAWLKRRLALSRAQWKIVYMHHPPYSSGKHGSSEWMQWPFHKWGADAVIAGHDHAYERIVRKGIPFFVNGLGGASPYRSFRPIPESQARFADDYGAMRIRASKHSIRFDFITRTGEKIDSYRIKRTPDKPAPLWSATPIALQPAQRVGLLDEDLLLSPSAASGAANLVF